MVIATPMTYSLSNCGAEASVTGVAGGNSFSLVDGEISAGVTCYVYVYVTANDPGTYTNTISPTNLTTTRIRLFQARSVTTCDSLIIWFQKPLHPMSSPGVAEVF